MCSYRAETLAPTTRSISGRSGSTGYHGRGHVDRGEIEEERRRFVRRTEHTTSPVHYTPLRVVIVEMIVRLKAQMKVTSQPMMALLWLLDGVRCQMSDIGNTIYCIQYYHQARGRLLYWMSDARCQMHLPAKLGARRSGCPPLCPPLFFRSLTQS